MGDPEMREKEHVPTELVRSGSRRVANRSSLQLSVSTVPLHSPRPASSVYSRSVNTHNDNHEFVAGSEEKASTVLNGWVHPALRPATTSISSITSFAGMLRRLGSNDEQNPYQRQPEEQDQQQQRHGTSFSVTGSGVDASTGSTADDICPGGIPYPSNNADAEQQGPVSSSAKASMRHKRRFGLSYIGFGALGTAIIAILIVIALIAAGKVRKGDAAATSQASSPSAAAHKTQSEMSSAISTRDYDVSSSAAEDVAATVEEGEIKSETAILITRPPDLPAATNVVPWPSTIKLTPGQTGWQTFTITVSYAGAEPKPFTLTYDAQLGSFVGAGDHPSTGQPDGDKPKDLLPPLRPTVRVTKEVTEDAQPTARRSIEDLLPNFAGIVGDETSQASLDE
ncbi:hypothetical protein VTO42DRAFT_1706 [Malbranchea cinnamomea]